MSHRTARTEESLTLSTSDDFTTRLITKTFSLTKFFILEFQRYQNGLNFKYSSNSREYVYNTQLTASGSQDSTFYNNSTSQDNSHGMSFGFRIRIRSVDGYGNFKITKFFEVKTGKCSKFIFLTLFSLCERPKSIPFFI